MGLSAGPYEVRDLPRQDESSTFQYKLLTTDPTSIYSTTSQSGKRTVEIVTHDQMVVQSPSKKPRLQEHLESPVVAVSRGRSLLVTSTGQQVLQMGASQVQTMLQGTQLATLQNGKVTQIQLPPVKPQPPSSPVFRVLSKKAAVMPVKRASTTQETPLIVSGEDVSGNQGGEPAAAEHTDDESPQVSMETDSEQQAVANVTTGSNQMLTVTYSTSSSGEVISQVVTQSMGNQVITQTVNSDGEVISSVAQDEAAGEIVSTDTEQSQEIVEGEERQVIMQTINSEGQVVDNEGQVIGQSFNSEGQLVDSSGQVMDEMVDDTGQVIHMVNSEGQVVDHEGNVIQTVDASGQIVAQSINSEGQLVTHPVVQASMLETTQEGKVGGQCEGQVVEGQQEVAVEEGSQEDGVLGQVVTDAGDGTQILLQQSEDGEHQVVDQSNVFQTEDGLVLIQNPDGTFQIHGHTDQPIPLETVQALLAMEAEGQPAQVQADQTQS